MSILQRQQRRLFFLGAASEQEPGRFAAHAYVISTSALAQLVCRLPTDCRRPCASACHQFTIKMALPVSNIVACGVKARLRAGISSGLALRIRIPAQSVESRKHDSAQSLMKHVVQSA
jgi:hypothetical protein